MLTKTYWLLVVLEGAAAFDTLGRKDEMFLEKSTDFKWRRGLCTFSFTVDIKATKIGCMRACQKYACRGITWRHILKYPWKNCRLFMGPVHRPCFQPVRISTTATTTSTTATMTSTASRRRGSPMDQYIVVLDRLNIVQSCPVDGSGCSTVAGTGAGGSGSTQLFAPQSAAIAFDGDYIVADSSNNRIQRCPADGTGPTAGCSTVAGTGIGGKGATQLFVPAGIAIAFDGDYVIGDSGNNRVQRCPADGTGPMTGCRTVAGTGVPGAASTQLFVPTAVGFTFFPGDYIIADFNNNRIQRCPANGSGPTLGCTTVAGTGSPGTGSTQLNRPYDVVVEFPSGDYVIADAVNNRIQRCPGNGAGPSVGCMTVAGTGSQGSGVTQLDFPTGIAIAANGDYVIADHSNSRIQRCPADGTGPTTGCRTVEDVVDPVDVAYQQFIT